MANVGVHGTSVDLQLQNLWIHNIKISMGLVNANTTPMLLKLVASGRLPSKKFATHHFSCTTSWTPTTRSPGPQRPRH